MNVTDNMVVRIFGLESYLFFKAEAVFKISSVISFYLPIRIIENF